MASTVNALGFCASSVGKVCVVALRKVSISNERVEVRDRFIINTGR